MRLVKWYEKKQLLYLNEPLKFIVLYMFMSIVPYLWKERTEKQETAHEKGSV